MAHRLRKYGIWIVEVSPRNVRPTACRVDRKTEVFSSDAQQSQRLIIDL